MVWQEDKNHAVIFLQMWRLGGTSVQCRKLCSATNSNTGRLGIILVRWWKGQGNFGTDQNCKGHWHEVAGIELYFIFISSLKWLWVNVLVVWVPCNYEIHSNRKGGKIDSRWEQCCFSFFFEVENWQSCYWQTKKANTGTDFRVAIKKKKQQLTKKINMVFLMTWASDNYS